MLPRSGLSGEPAFYGGGTKLCGRGLPPKPALRAPPRSQSRSTCSCPRSAAHRADRGIAPGSEPSGHRPACAKSNADRGIAPGSEPSGLRLSSTPVARRTSRIRLDTLTRSHAHTLDTLDTLGASHLRWRGEDVLDTIDTLTR